MKITIRVYVTLVVAAACVVVGTAGWATGSASGPAHWNAVAALAVLGFLTEASYFFVKVGRTQTQSAISFIPYIASYLLFDSGWAVAIAGCAMLAVETVVRRKPPIRVIFNVAQLVVTVGLAAFVYQNLGGSWSLESFRFNLLAFSVSVLTYFVVNSTAVSIAVTLGERVSWRQSWIRIAGSSLVYDLVSAPLAAILAFLYVRTELVGILILILPLYFLRHVYLVYIQLEQVNRDLLELMVKAIEARDPYTSGHSLRVSQMAETLARDLGLGHKLVEQIRTAALLHDVGKIHEEYAPLLRKEGRLDATEKALMQTHSARSADLVSTISAFKGTITDAVRWHHENFDGTGYPDGLAGRAIPIGSRIIMIADTVDAMTTDRPYRKALSFERVIQELNKFAGRQFDPELVEVCLRSPTIRTLVETRVESQYLPSVATLDDEAPKYAPSIRSGSSGLRRQKSAT